MRETPGAETYAPDAWEREATDCRSEGIPVPDRAEHHRRALEAGWTPWEALHEQLYEWYAFARYGTKAPGIVEASEEIVWPWCRSSLQEHVHIIAHHFVETERIAVEERPGR